MKPKPKRREVWINVATDPNRYSGLYGGVYESEGMATQNMRREGGTPIRFVEAPKRRKRK